MTHSIFKKLRYVATALAVTTFGHSAQAVDAALETAPANGWASQAGGTLGGSAATSANIFTVSNRTQLLNAIANGGSLAKIIKVIGTIDMSEGVAFASHADQVTRGAITLPSNTTLIGDATNAGIVNGYINISGVTQIIIRNLKIVAPCDVTPIWDAAEGNWVSSFQAVQVSASNHVWIDGNTFTDTPVTNDNLAIENGKVKECHDGALDIKDASDYVTVSFNLFNLHNKNSMVGASDTASGDSGHLTVTFSNNAFTNIAMRSPRVRYGQVHLFNNYYAGSKSHPIYAHSYSVGAGVQAKILSNNNSFNVGGAAVCDDVIANPSSTAAVGAFKDSGSTLNGVPLAGCLVPNSVTWTIPYSFAPRPAALVKTFVLSQSGAGKLTTTVTGSGNTSSSSSSSSASSAPVVSNVWSEPFSAASTATFFTAAYKAQPNNSSSAMYSQLNGSSNITLNGNTMVLNGNRFAVGATATTASTSTSAPAGVLDLAGKACTLTVNVTAHGSTAGKMFQVSINNNQTSSGASPLGAASRVVNVDASTLAIGVNTFTWSNIGTSTSFLMFRTESSASVTMDSASLDCSGGSTSTSSSSSSISSSSSSSVISSSSSSSSSVISSSSSSSIMSSSSSSSSIGSSSSSSSPYAGPAETTAVGYGNAVTGAGSSPATKVTVSSMAAAQAAIDAYYGSAGLEITYNGTVDFSPYYDTSVYTGVGAPVKDQKGLTLNAGDVLTCTLHTQTEQTLQIKGTASKPKNNITLIGSDGSSAQFSIHVAATANNILIRNMTIGLTPGGDASDIISLEGMGSSGIPKNIWIDHNNFFTKNIACAGAGDTSFDGMIDVKKGVENVTVSYNYLHDHAKTSLNGFSDSETEVRHITFVHNVFENMSSRTPLQRIGYSHMLNNYFNNIYTSGINVRMGGYSLVEGNFFRNVQNPVTSRDSSAIGFWELRNNNVMSTADFSTYGITWVTSSSTPAKDANDWLTTAIFPSAEMTYTYTANPAACIEAGLPAVVGAGKGLASLKCN